MAKAKKKRELSLEEKLNQILVSVDEQPYEVPENWCWIRLLDAFDNLTDSKKKLPAKEYLEEGLCPVVDQGQEFIGGYTNTENILYEGELPVVVFGDHTRCMKYIDFPFVQGADGVKVLRPKSFWDSKAFYYAFKSVEIPNLGYRRHYPLFKDFCIPVPPLAEQKRIVEQIENLFTKLEEVKATLEDSLDEIDKRSKIVLHNFFTGKYISNSCSDVIEQMLEEIISCREEMISRKEIQRAKVVPVGEQDKLMCIPQNWKQVKLGEIAFVTKLAGFEYTKYISLQEEGEVPVIRAQNVKKGYLNLKNVLYIDKKTSELLERSALKKKSLLITFIGAGIGDVCIFDKTERYHLAPNVAKVELFGDNLLNAEYILYYLLSDIGQKEIFKSMKATAQPSLSMETIRDIVIPIPELSIQNQIVDLISVIKEKELKEMELIKNTLSQIELIKKTILSKAFRGELGTNNANEESAVELLKSIFANE